MRSIAIGVLLCLCTLILITPKQLSAQTCEDNNWDSRFFRPGQIAAIESLKSGKGILKLLLKLKNENNSNLSALLDNTRFDKEFPEKTQD